MEVEKLIRAANDAKEQAYVPYSSFRVGAALLTRSGKIFTGCNVENASFGLTNCAERTAIFKAVSEGHRDFVSITVASDSEDIISPCGACRQVIAEFGRQIQVILTNPKGEYRIETAESLLPYGFSNDQME